MDRKDISFQPVASQQQCQCCDNKAVISINIYPAARLGRGGLVTFVWLCQDHTQELVSTIITQGFENNETT